MSFYIREIISRLLAPQHELSCSWLLWRKLIRDLRNRGHNYRRESGAFLLGRKRNGRAKIVSFVLYDDLDSKCLDTGIVRFDGRHFGKLWDICKSTGLVVVADVHTHPGNSQQSDSDRAHPMITSAGHIALIVPRYAADPVTRKEVGMYRYQGGGKWDAVAVGLRRRFLHLGI
jgi:proteasome lid subunit RPN8/RPN11